MLLQLHDHHLVQFEGGESCLREASCRAATKAPTLWFAQVADDRVVSALDEILNREVDSRISRRHGIAPTGTASVPN